jgi:hypothetical protein
VLNAIDLDVSKLQKAYDELMAMRIQLSKTKSLKLSKERSDLSRTKSNLLPSHLAFQH